MTAPDNIDELWAFARQKQGQEILNDLTELGIVKQALEDELSYEITNNYELKVIPKSGNCYYVDMLTLSHDNQLLFKVDNDGVTWLLTLGDLEVLRVLEYKQSFYI